MIAPGLFAMQFVARWGNFFNQELYGPPTSAAVGHRDRLLPPGGGVPCPPAGTTPIDAHFQPLFLYESISGLVGMLSLLWLANRYAARLRTGEIALVFFIWYAIVRFLLEYLRVDNWTFFGIPTAQIISTVVVVASAIVLAVRRGRVLPGLTMPPTDAELDDAEGSMPAEAGAPGA